MAEDEKKELAAENLYQAEEEVRKQFDDDASDIQSFVSQYRAKHPNAVLFSIKVGGREFVSRIGSFDEVMKFSKLFADNAADTSETAISFLQKYILFPKLSHDELAHEMLSGHVVQLLKAVQKANGFEDEAEIKKL